MGSGSEVEKARELMRRAQHDLDVARSLLEDEFLPDAVNRAYFTAYRSARAYLVRQGLEPRTHSGTIQQFGEHGVQPGDFDPAMGKIISRLEQERIRADYVADPDFTSAEAERLVEDADRFLGEIEAFLELEDR